jgi:hypothetical protein
MCTDNGTDIIFVYPDLETPFPELKIPPVFEMQVRKGYGVEYCQKVLGLEPKVVNL